MFSEYYKEPICKKNRLFLCLKGFLIVLRYVKIYIANILRRGKMKGFLTEIDEQGNMKSMGDMRVGIEVEFTGLNRRKLAKRFVRLGYFKKCIEETHMVSGSARIRLRLVDLKNRAWYLVVDRSILPESKSGKNVSGNIDYMCELVTPVLETEYDMLFFYSIIREIENRGGRVNSTCGIHIHVDAPKEVEVLKEIFERFLANQRKYAELFDIPTYRLEKYTKLYDDEFIEDFKDKKSSILSREDFLDFIYDRLGEGKPRDDEKNPARYFILNFDTMYKRGTLEFRMFNSTLKSKTINKYLGWVYSFINYKKEGSEMSY